MLQLADCGLNQQQKEIDRFLRTERELLVKDRHSYKKLMREAATADDSWADSELFNDVIMRFIDRSNTY